MCIGGLWWWEEILRQRDVGVNSWKLSQHPLKWEGPRGEDEALTAPATVTTPPGGWGGAKLALLGHG